MADFKYKVNWVPSAKQLRDQVTQEEQPSSGIGAKPPTDDRKEENSDFYSKMFDALVPFFDSEEEAKDVIEGAKPDRKSVQSMTIEEFEQMAEDSADLVSQARDVVGITRSYTPEEASARQRQIREELDERRAKDTDADAADGVQPSDGKATTGLMAKPTKSTTEAKEIATDRLGISEEQWDAYREEVAAIESGGVADPYAAKGGANDHYDGMYQLGKVAKQDAAQLLGISLGHSAKEREAYRKDPELQEKAFAAYTAKNHSYLMKKSDKYRELPTKEKLAVLGFAHNQGWGGANKWLRTGEVGQDAFGTKGTKYYDAIIERLSE